jgi:hypothetical protein
LLYRYPVVPRRPHPVLHSTILPVWPDWPIIQEQSRLPDNLPCGREILCAHGVIVDWVKVKAKFRGNVRSADSPRARENDLDRDGSARRASEPVYFCGEKF